MIPQRLFLRGVGPGNPGRLLRKIRRSNRVMVNSLRYPPCRAGGYLSEFSNRIWLFLLPLYDCTHTHLSRQEHREVLNLPVVVPRCLHPLIGEPGQPLPSFLYLVNEVIDDDKEDSSFS